MAEVQKKCNVLTLEEKLAILEGCDKLLKMNHFDAAMQLKITERAMKENENLNCKSSCSGNNQVEC
jgi:hypothetical protein